MAAAPQPILQPDVRGVARELQERGVFLDILVLRVPAPIALRESTTTAIASTGGNRVLSAEEGTALRDRIAGEKGVTILQAPKILALPGQEATVFVGETYAAEGQTQPPLRFDADASNWAGHRFKAVATPSADGASLALDFSFTLRDMPPKDSKPDLAALAAGEVRGRVSVDLPKGSGLLISTPAGAATPNDRLFVFVDARVLGAAAKTPQ